MDWIKILQDEWNQELVNTKKILQAIPANFDWKPHEKSMSLGRLATHVAEIPEWMTVTIETAELDFSKGYNPNVCQTPADVMALFEKISEKSVNAIQKLTEEALQSNWTLRNGEQIYFTMSKPNVIRQFVISHLVHHRAQLGVYLRLLNVAIPGTYGPSADDAGMK